MDLDDEDSRCDVDKDSDINGLDYQNINPISKKLIQLFTGNNHQTKSILSPRQQQKEQQQQQQTSKHDYHPCDVRLQKLGDDNKFDYDDIDYFDDQKFNVNHQNDFLTSTNITTLSINSIIDDNSTNRFDGDHQSIKQRSVIVFFDDQHSQSMSTTRHHEHNQLKQLTFVEKNHDDHEENPIQLTNNKIQINDHCDQFLYSTLKSIRNPNQLKNSQLSLESLSQQQQQNNIPISLINNNDYEDFYYNNKSNNHNNNNENEDDHDDSFQIQNITNNFPEKTLSPSQSILSLNAFNIGKKQKQQQSSSNHHHNRFGTKNVANIFNGFIKPPKRFLKQSWSSITKHLSPSHHHHHHSHNHLHHINNNDDYNNNNNSHDLNIDLNLNQSHLFDCDNNFNNNNDNDNNNNNDDTHIGSKLKRGLSTGWSPLHWKSSILELGHFRSKRSRAFSNPDILINAIRHPSNTNTNTANNNNDNNNTDEDFNDELIVEENLFQNVQQINDQLDGLEQEEEHEESEKRNRKLSKASIWSKTKSSPMMDRLKKLRKDMKSCIKRKNSTVTTDKNNNLYQDTDEDDDDDDDDDVDYVVCQPSSIQQNNENRDEVSPAKILENIVEEVEEKISKSSFNLRKRFSKIKAKTIDTTTNLVGINSSTKTTAKLDSENHILEIESSTSLLPSQPAQNSSLNSITKSGMDSTKPDIVEDAVPLQKAANYEEIMRLQRVHNLLQYRFFLIDIHLKCGKNLLAKDTNGTSDPYVKFKIGNQCLHKSQTKFKTLNPIWDEYLVLPIEDICQPLMLKVYDYDYFFMDDFLGTTSIDLTKLEPGITTDLELSLLDEVGGSKEKINQEDRGEISISIRLNPKTQEEREHYYGRGKWTNIPGIDGHCNKRIKTIKYDSIVSVVLIRGSNMEMDSDYGVRLKLGTEKFKSKIVSKNVTEPYWAEQFEMHLYSSQSKVLEITLVPNQSSSSDDCFGKVCTDLSELETERTHHIIHKFDIITNTNPKTNPESTKLAAIQANTATCSTLIKKQCSIEMLVTITGCIQKPTINPQTINEETTLEECNNNQQQQQQQPQSMPPIGWDSNNFKDVKDIFNMSKLYENFFDVGTLMVKVHRAENLASADINGKSDPFCVLELVNERLRTSTEYKTLSPEWNKTFKFKIKDIHDVLEVTIYDEDKDRVEFLGKIAIPLLKIHNGEKRWYALKDKKLRNRVKGHIFLECWISYSKIKASVLTLTPKPTKYIKSEVKFKRSLLIRNVMRLKNIGMELMEISQFLHSCIQWESPSRSLLTFFIFLSSVYYFEFYMIPMALLLIILMNWFGIKIRNYYNPIEAKEKEFIDDNYDFCYDDNEERKSLKEKIHTVQEISTLVMTIIGQVASYIERVKNATNFTVPYLSWLAIIILAGCSLVLYIIPFRYIVLIYGINAFTKKFRYPNAANNNEIIDFLSRVPDMEEKIMYTEFKPTIQYDASGRIISHHQQQQQQNPGPTTTGSTLSSSEQQLFLDDDNPRRSSSTWTLNSLIDRKKKK